MLWVHTHIGSISASTSTMCACVGSLKAHCQWGVARTTHPLSIGDVLEEVQLLQCLRKRNHCISARTSAMCVCVGSLEPRRRCALAGTTHRVSIDGVLGEIQLSLCLKQCISHSSVSTSPMCIREGSLEPRRRWALSSATHCLPIGGVLAEIQLLQCLR
jgi:hypothetical protein